MTTSSPRAEVPAPEGATRRIEPEALAEIVAEHHAWLRGEDSGKRADLSYVDLRGADLRYANLNSADLRSAKLSYADLSSAYLSYADLRFAHLSYAKLIYANLSYADLRSANVSYADLSSADLSYSDLRSADVSYADLSYADLSYADLRSANLGYANVSYANVRSANLSYAELSYANLNAANLESVKHLPEGWLWWQGGRIGPNARMLRAVSTPDYGVRLMLGCITEPTPDELLNALEVRRADWEQSLGTERADAAFVQCRDLAEMAARFFESETTVEETP